MTCPGCGGELTQGRLYITDCGIFTVLGGTCNVQFTSQRLEDSLVLGPGEDPCAYRCKRCGTLVLLGKLTSA
jgi:hypothetical protein